jgi:hypothetical protein
MCGVWHGVCDDEEVCGGRRRQGRMGAYEGVKIAGRGRSGASVPTCGTGVYDDEDVCGALSCLFVGCWWDRWYKVVVLPIPVMV